MAFVAAGLLVIGLVAGIFSLVQRWRLEHAIDELVRIDEKIVQHELETGNRTVTHTVHDALYMQVKRFGDKALPRLVDLLDHPNRWVRKDACELISEISGQDFGVYRNGTLVPLDSDVDEARARIKGWWRDNR